MRRFDGSSLYNTGIEVPLAYPAGKASGMIVTSDVGLSGGSNWTLINQAWALVDHVTPFDFFQATTYSGRIGLGLPAASEVQKQLYDATGNPNTLNDVSDATSTGSILAEIWSGRPVGARYIALGLQRLPSEGGHGTSTLGISRIDPS